MHYHHIYHIFFISITILCAHSVSTPNCDIQGYTLSSSSDEACKTLNINCADGDEKWVIEGCGCGCKPACVELGASWYGSASTCQLIRFSCPSGYERWEDTDCGCGCAPDSASSKSVESM